MRVKVHSFTLSYTLESMKHDSRASLLAHTFANPCFRREPKVKVTIDFKDKRVNAQLSVSTLTKITLPISPYKII